MGLETIAIAALVVGAGATAGSIYNGNKANRLAADAAATQKKQADMQVARERRNLVREGRITAAASLVASEGKGASRSSGAQGGYGSILSQTMEGTHFSDLQKELGDQASRQLGKAQKYSNYASMFSQGADLAFSAASFAAGGGMGGSTGGSTAAEPNSAAKMGGSYNGLFGVGT